MQVHIGECKTDVWIGHRCGGGGTGVWPAAAGAAEKQQAGAPRSMMCPSHRKGALGPRWQQHCGTCGPRTPQSVHGRRTFWGHKREQCGWMHWLEGNAAQMHPTGGTAQMRSLKQGALRRPTLWVLWAQLHSSAQGAARRGSACVSEVVCHVPWIRVMEVFSDISASVWESASRCRHVGMRRYDRGAASCQATLDGCQFEWRIG